MSGGHHRKAVERGATASRSHQNKSGSAAFIQADLSQPDQVKRIVPFALETFGRLDYAFNNAGISGDNRLLTNQTQKNFDGVFAVNVRALFLLLQDELKQMIVQGEEAQSSILPQLVACWHLQPPGHTSPANTLCLA